MELQYFDNMLTKVTTRVYSSKEVVRLESLFKVWINANTAQQDSIILFFVSH